MEKFNYDFEGFSTREGFNQSLRHFRAVMSVLEDLQQGINIADSVYEKFTPGELTSGQLISMVHALLVDKFGYKRLSINLPENNDELAVIPTEIAKWKAADLVLTYFHPESGMIVLNPKNPKHMEMIGSIKKFELINIFVGAFDNTEKLLSDRRTANLFDTILDKAAGWISGKQPKSTPAMLKGKFSFKPINKKTVQTETVEPQKRGPGRRPKKEVPTVTVDVQSQSTPAQKATTSKKPVQRQAPTGRMKTIGPVAVRVSNELFHNGNVEAWKRIIMSYTSKYPNCIVNIYYDGEKIHDINSLFKWGKVKHGTSIMFSVSSPGEISDISKLRKYLIQGASSRFEAFLKGPVGKVLELF